MLTSGAGRVIFVVRDNGGTEMLYMLPILLALVVLIVRADRKMAYPFKG